MPHAEGVACVRHVRAHPGKRVRMPGLILEQARGGQEGGPQPYHSQVPQLPNEIGFDAGAIVQVNCVG
jgi:hypothetical protein